MEKDDIGSLIKYLKDIIGCESSLVNAKEKLKRYERMISKLCIPKKLSIPVTPTPPTVVTSDGVSLFFLSLLFIFVFAPILNAQIGLNLISKIVFMIGSGLLGVLGVIESIYSYKKRLKTYNSQKLKYEDDLWEYEMLQSSESDRMTWEKKCQESYVNNAKTVKELINQIEEALGDLYGKNILHKKYQHVEAVVSICEYLSNGLTRSLELDGTDPGAYNLYERKVLNNAILREISTTQSNMNAKSYCPTLSFLPDDN